MPHGEYAINPSRALARHVGGVPVCQISLIPTLRKYELT